MSQSGICTPSQRTLPKHYCAYPPTLLALSHICDTALILCLYFGPAIPADIALTWHGCADLSKQTSTASGSTAPRNPEVTRAIASLSKPRQTSKRKRKNVALLEDLSDTEDAATAATGGPPSAGARSAESTGGRLGRNEYSNYIYAGSLPIYALYQPINRLLQLDPHFTDIISRAMETAITQDGCLPLDTPIPDQQAICITTSTKTLCTNIVQV